MSTPEHAPPLLVGNGRVEHPEMTGDWRAVALEGARAEMAQRDAEIEQLEAALKDAKERRREAEKFMLVATGQSLTAPKKVKPKPTTRATSHPGASSGLQDRVYEALASIGHPVPVRDVTGHPDLADKSRSSVQGALSHLRTAGRVRWAGKAPGPGGGHLWDIWRDDDAENED